MSWENRATVAVLPFRSEGSDAAPYFGDGMTEEIIGSLSLNRSLFVIARNSTLKYRNHDSTASDIASALGVRYLLEGSVRRHKQRLRIHAVLLDAASNREIWSERYDGVDEDLFTFQDQIASSISAAIDPRVREAEISRIRVVRPTASTPTTASCAVSRSSTTSIAAISNRRRDVPARDRDRSVVRSGARPSRLVAQPAHRRGPQHERWRRLAARRRVRPACGRARSGRRLVARGLRPHPVVPEEAVSSGARSFRSGPGAQPELRHRLGAERVDSRYTGQARRLWHGSNAFRLSPFDQLSFWFCTTNGIASIVAGRLDESVSWLNKALRLNPRYRASTRMLIAAQALSGEIDEARQLAAEFLEGEPGFTVSGFGSWYPLQPPYLERVMDGLRLAGLPP